MPGTCPLADFQFYKLIAQNIYFFMQYSVKMHKNKISNLGNFKLCCYFKGNIVPLQS